MEVYKMTCSVNGKIYIGSTKYTAYDRIFDLSSSSSHISRARDGDTNPLYEDIRKYGIEAFNIETIEFLDNRLDAYRREDYWIKFYWNLLGEDMMYNNKNSACGNSNWSVPFIKENQEKAAAARREKYGTANGRCLTEEAKQKAKETKIKRYGTVSACDINPKSRESQKKKISKKILDKETNQIIYGYKSLVEKLNNIGYTELTLDKVKKSFYNENHSLRYKYPEIYERFILL